MGIAQAILQFIASLPQLFALYKQLQKEFGPDLTKVLPQITEAWGKWNSAQTPEEEDEALKAMARARNRRSN